MGKFDSKRHKDLRDFKSKEIKKSLTHRARLRKNYFKLMDKEKQEHEEKEQREKAKMRISNEDLNPQDNDDQSNDQSNDETDSKSQPIQSKPPTPKVDEDPFEKRKQLTYQERSKLIKERKEEKRKQQIQYMNEKKEKIEKAKRQRERLNKKLSRTTKYGQPLMGPRITNLLDKIKQNQD